MIALLLTVARLVRAVWVGLKDPEFRALFAMAGTMLLSGTLFYRSVEGWSVLDSLYFSVATLTTVGYGDTLPATDVTRSLAIIEGIFGVMYVAVMIARFVGLRGLATPESAAPEQVADDRDRINPPP